MKRWEINYNALLHKSIYTATTECLEIDWTGKTSEEREKWKQDRIKELYFQFEAAELNK